jgi:hypothetical protein
MTTGRINQITTVNPTYHMKPKSHTTIGGSESPLKRDWFRTRRTHSENAVKLPNNGFVVVTVGTRPRRVKE